MRDFSERKLTAGYLFALGLIALLTIASHLTLNRVLAEHEGSAAIINISGRQRMLSQRIASLAAQYRLGSPTAKADLLVAVNKFEVAHHKLLADTSAESTVPGGPGPGPGGPGGRGAFRDVYFGGASPLDAEVAAYVSLARHVVNAPQTATGIDSDLGRLFAEARSPLLTRLDEVVQLHQQDSEAQMGRLEWLQRLTLVVVLITLATEALLIFRPMVRRISRYSSDLLRLATTDPLTGALNRRSFFERGESEIARARRTGRPVTVLMLDVDHFKQINDVFGHAGGDAALQALTQAMASVIRPTDLLGRMGGEEFAVLLPDISREAASVLAERLRGTIAGLTISHGGKAIQLTASVGVAASAGDSADLKRLLHDADLALYAAKNSGRNRVAAACIPARAGILLAEAI